MPYLHIKTNQNYIPEHIRIIKTDYVYERDNIQNGRKNKKGEKHGNKVQVHDHKTK